MSRIVERCHRSSPGLWAAIPIVIACVGVVSTAPWILTEFAAWDDEGYMLVSLNHYLANGGLYSQTFSFYGPFYFYAQQGFFQLLGLSVTHDAGRLVTLIYWIAASLLASLFVYRVSNSVFLACAALLCAFLASRFLTGEPGHPQQLVLLLYMAACCLSQPGQLARFGVHLFFLGTIGAALAFTKANVGIFYIAGLAHALICLLPSGRFRSTCIGLTLAYAAVFPGILMRQGFGHGFRGYLMLATVTGIATFTCGALVSPHSRLPRNTVIFACAGLVTGILLIVSATSREGVNFDALVQGVVLNAVHASAVFFYPPRFSALSPVFALVVSIGMVIARIKGTGLSVAPWFGMLRCTVGIATIVLLTLSHRIEWVIPFLPLTLIPTRQPDKDAA
jgi:hypothetical protein